MAPAVASSVRKVYLLSSVCSYLLFFAYPASPMGVQVSSCLWNFLQALWPTVTSVFSSLLGLLLLAPPLKPRPSLGKLEVTARVHLVQSPASRTVISLYWWTKAVSYTILSIHWFSVCVLPWNIYSIYEKYVFWVCIFSSQLLRKLYRNKYFSNFSYSI